jgi:hypothetical protein
LAALGRAKRSNGPVLVVQPSWGKGELVGTHEHGKGRRNVPTFNSSGIERANFGHVRPPLRQLRACARLRASRLRPHRPNPVLASSSADVASRRGGPSPAKRPATAGTTHEHGKGARDVPTWDSQGAERASFGHAPAPPPPRLRPRRPGPFGFERSGTLGAGAEGRRRRSSVLLLGHPSGICAGALSPRRCCGLPCRIQSQSVCMAIHSAHVPRSSESRE